MSDREREALEKAHLTARQASLIARRLGARKVVPMHISPRYHHRVEEVMEELDAAKNGAQP
jgi:ribonuclease Z